MSLVNIELSTVSKIIDVNPGIAIAANHEFLLVKVDCHRGDLLGQLVAF